jgi:hypothetical protein
MAILIEFGGIKKKQKTEKSFSDWVLEQFRIHFRNEGLSDSEILMLMKFPAPSFVRGDLAAHIADWFSGTVDEPEGAPLTDARKKKRKKNCGTRGHNGLHKADGTFAPKNYKGKGSFSLWFASKGQKGCKGGRAQYAGGSERFTKADNCGRKTKDGDKKNQYKCSDPKEKYK